MSAKEKAEQLAVKFHIFPLGPHVAKHSASNACDMVIEQIKLIQSYCDLRSIDLQETQKDIQFWNEVKQHLNNQANAHTGK